jgi:hypothetical protein
MSLADIMADVKSKCLLIPEIDFYLRSIPLMDASHSDQWIHPSMLNQCARRIQLQLIKADYAQDVVDPQLKRVFENGTQYHRRMQKLLKKAGLVKEEDLEFRVESDEYHLHGNMDGKIFLQDEWWILELKSIKTEKFKQLRKTGVDQNYIVQIHAYMLMSEIPRAIFLYEDKNTQELYEVEVYQNDHIIELLSV